MSEAIPVTVAPRPSWSAILSGAFAALGIGIFLFALGIAIFFSAADNSPKGAMDWLAIWSLIVPIISVFFGALLCARIAGPTNRFGGALHGLSVWGFFYVIGGVVLALFLTPILTSASTLAGSALSTAGNAATAVAGSSGKVASTLGLDANTFLGPVNQKLEARGQNPLTVAQLKTAIDDGVRASIAHGTFNKQIFVNTVAHDTSLTPAEANDVFGSVGGGLGNIKSSVRSAYNHFVDGLSLYTWFLFISIGLALIGALLGSSLAVSRTQREYQASAFQGRREVHP
jgi:hypothetical protein